MRLPRLLSSVEVKYYFKRWLCETDAKWMVSALGISPLAFANRKPFLFEVCDYIQVDNRCVASTNRYITSNMACTLQP